MDKDATIARVGEGDRGMVRVRYAAAQISSGGCPFMTTFDLPEADYAKAAPPSSRKKEEAWKKVDEIKKDLGDQVGRADRQEELVAAVSRQFPNCAAEQDILLRCLLLGERSCLSRPAPSDTVAPQRMGLDLVVGTSQTGIFQLCPELDAPALVVVRYRTMIPRETGLDASLGISQAGPERHPAPRR